MYNLTVGNANEAWKKAFLDLKNGPDIVYRRGGLGDNLDLNHSVIEITNPRDRFVYSRYPRINIVTLLANFIALITGRNNQEKEFTIYQSHQQAIINENEVSYGNRIFSTDIDQIGRCYRILKESVNSRQAVITIWDKKDLQDGNCKLGCPCNVMAMPKIVNGKLDWMQIVRSNDIILGFPYNVAQFTMLQEVLAGLLGVEVGSYVHVADSLHLYIPNISKYDIHDDEKYNDLKNTDNLGVPYKDFYTLRETCSILIDEIYKKFKDFEMIKFNLLYMDSLNLPQAYKNIFYILISRLLYIDGCEPYMKTTLDLCTNKIYTELFKEIL